MIVDYKNELVFFATTKVASTSIEKGFSRVPRMGKISGHARLRHINFSTYLQIEEPLGLARFSTIAPVRHPFDKAVSWYKFRSREKKEGHHNYLGNNLFSEYIKNLGKKEIALICDRQFVTDLSSQRQVDYLIKFENIQEFLILLNEIYGDDFSVQRRNVSPDVISDFEESRSLFEQLFEAEIKWYENLPTGGLEALAELTGAPLRVAAAVE